MRKVFPALAGVIPSSVEILLSRIGFSRTRGGDPIIFHKDRINRFVFPALAGVIPVSREDGFLYLGFSRTRGGDPMEEEENILVLSFFPHTRG